MAWTPPPQPTPFNKRPEDVLFIDIETVPSVSYVNDLPEQGIKLFSKIAERFIDEKRSYDDFLNEMFFEKSALYCEFSKIACVSMGVFTTGDNGERILRVKSFYGYNESIILQELAPKLGVAKILCAHNGKKFDFPLLARKYVQHGITIPSILNVTGIKPWEVSHFDTMEIWQFNDMKNFTSLDTLAYVFGLPSPKQDMDGSKVAEVYYGPSKLQSNELPWEDKTLEPIARYCEGDVVTMANVYLRLINQPIVKPENIVIV